MLCSIGRFGLAVHFPQQYCGAVTKSQCTVGALVAQDTIAIVHTAYHCSTCTHSEHHTQRHVYLDEHYVAESTNQQQLMQED